MFINNISERSGGRKRSKPIYSSTDSFLSRAVYSSHKYSNKAIYNIKLKKPTAILSFTSK